MTGRHGQSGAHRDVHVPWRVSLHCWLYGHDLEHLPTGWWLCQRCDRKRRTPVEM